MMKIPSQNKSYNLEILKHGDFIDFDSNTNTYPQIPTLGYIDICKCLLHGIPWEVKLFHGGAATSEAAEEPQKSPHSKTPCLHLFPIQGGQLLVRWVGGFLRKKKSYQHPPYHHHQTKTYAILQQINSPLQSKIPSKPEITLCNLRLQQSW